MTETERQVKLEKFFKYLEEFIEKEEKSELINLSDIYEDYGHPKYDSPKRILHSKRGKEMIRYEIERHDMQIEKVIRYDGQTVFGNYNLALHYLKSIDAYNYFLFIDLLMKSEPDILEKYIKR